MGTGAKPVFPVVLFPTAIGRTQTSFLTLQNRVEVEMPAAFARRLVRACDGTRSLASVAGELAAFHPDPSFAGRLCVALVEHGVLHDALDLSPVVGGLVDNPALWSRPHWRDAIVALVNDRSLQAPAGPAAHRLSLVETPFTSVLRARRSTRRFAALPLAPETLTRLLWSAYGRTDETSPRRTVASAGALYPIVVHLALFRASGDIAAGLYRVVASRHDGVDLEALGDDVAAVVGAFVDSDPLAGAAGVVVIGALYARSAVKYANRAMLLTTLEAGHVAQNLVLAAAGEGVGALEIAGFYDETLGRAAKLPARVRPLLAVAFGAEALGPALDARPALEQVVRRLEVLDADSPAYRPPFVTVTGEIRVESGVLTTCGRSPDAALARIKATAEGVEWYAFAAGRYAGLVAASLDELGPRAVDPRSMMRYASVRAARSHGLFPFDSSATYDWRAAGDVVRGGERMVLADFVYGAFRAREGRRYVRATTSGTAAHRTADEAFARALLELVEREAFMVTWLNTLRRATLRPATLPARLAARLRAIERTGCGVHVLDLTLDLAPVLMVVIESAKMPFIACTSACGFDPESTLDAALMEAELQLARRLQDGRPARGIVAPEEVESVSDHPALYQAGPYFARAAFLRGRRPSVSLAEVFGRAPCRSVEQVVTALHRAKMPVLRVDLSAGDALLEALPYRVVRVLVPGMVPLSFGYGLAPTGLTRARSLPFACGLVARRPRVAELNNFPHPFA